jgi:hypothetical protein
MASPSLLAKKSEELSPVDSVSNSSSSIPLFKDFKSLKKISNGLRDKLMTLG